MINFLKSLENVESFSVNGDNSIYIVENKIYLNDKVILSGKGHFIGSFINRQYFVFGNEKDYYLKKIDFEEPYRLDLGGYRWSTFNNSEVIIYNNKIRIDGKSLYDYSKINIYSNKKMN